MKPKNAPGFPEALWIAVDMTAEGNAKFIEAFA
jgi:hypothetical protein